MYAYIDGKLAFKSPSYVVIDAGGVGYHINISLNTYTAHRNCRTLQTIYLAARKRGWAQPLWFRR